MGFNINYASPLRNWKSMEIFTFILVNFFHFFNFFFDLGFIVLIQITVKAKDSLTKLFELVTKSWLIDSFSIDTHLRAWNSIKAQFFL